MTNWKVIYYMKDLHLRKEYNMIYLGKKTVNDFEIKQYNFAKNHSDKQIEIFINTDGLLDIRLSKERALSEHEIYEIGVYYKEMEKGNAFDKSIVGDINHRVNKRLLFPPQTIMGKIIDDHDWD